MARKKVKVSIFFSKDLIEGLEILGAIKQMSRSECIREGVELLLSKHRKEIALEQAKEVRFKHVVPIIKELKEKKYNKEAESFKEAVLEEIDKAKEALDKVEV